MTDDLKEPVSKFHCHDSASIIAPIDEKRESAEIEIDPVPLSQTLLNAEPIENEFQFQEMLQKHSASYGKYFRSNEEYTTFMMLPVPDDKRVALLRVMLEDAKMQMENRILEYKNKKHGREETQKAIH